MLGIIWNVIWPIVSPWWTAWRLSRHKSSTSFHPKIPAPQLVVTLVHGTFAMMSEWTQPGSRFVERLKKALEEHGMTAVQFHRFPWSGGNSFAARKKAQDELAKHILEVAKKHRDVPHYIVSHSHGGNVALAALRAPVGYDLRMMSVAAVDRLVNEGRNLVIVALVGTDLHIRIFDVSGKKVVDKAESELVSGKTLTALKKQLTLQLHKNFNQQTNDPVFYRIKWIFDCIRSMSGLNPIPDESGFSKKDKQKIIGDATSIAGHTPSQRPRAVYAQRVVATTIAVIALPIPFVTEYQEWLIAILAELPVVIVVLWLWIVGRPVVGPGLEMMFYVPLNLLLGVFAMPFAPELVLFSAYLDISAEPTPVGQYLVLELAGGTSDLSLGGPGGQSHSTYDDEKCPPGIARWICKPTLSA